MWAGAGMKVAFRFHEIATAQSLRGRVFVDNGARHVRIPFREIATSRFALLAMTVAKYRSALFYNVIL